MSSTNMRYKVNNPLAFYFTPDWVVHALFNNFPKLVLAAKTSPLWLEPTAGKGHIVKAIKKHFEYLEDGPVIQAIEIQKQFESELKQSGADSILIADYLKYIPNEGLEPDAIIANPPFPTAQDIIEHSQAIIAKGGIVAMFLRIGFLESERRWPFWNRPENNPDILLFHDRVSCTEDGKTDSCPHAWYIWHPEQSGRWTLV